MDCILQDFDTILKDNDNKIKSFQRKAERLKQLNILIEQIKQDYLEEGV